ncbi:MAG: SDR family oxidoreductase, partial [Gemmatimonadetes bacterium]|nr:SDR family oxidoreductase [Gemmatimonadota bacterium]
HFKARGGGSIINISSVHGIQGGEVNTVYAATKGGIIGVTQALATELAPFSIRANTISPGAINVGHSLESCLEKIQSEHHEEFLRLFGDRYDPVHRYFQPLETIGLPQDIAWCAVYLASEESRFVTGQNIAVDGGVTTYLSGGPLESSRSQKRDALRQELQEWIAAHAKSDAR